jgi:anti-sigma regulatory factor (Ser/Thr protein kinase)
VRLQLTPTVQAPGEARRKLTPLGDWMDEASLAKVRSVVSELLAISVSHGASRLIELSLDLDDGDLDGTLVDRGAAARALSRAREGEDNPLALRIVDSLVEEWGIDAGQAGIWFRLVVEPLT